MGKLSKYEKETIVNFNEGETEATVYTHNVGRRCHLCIGEVKTVYPSCTALQ